jgi:hypothetical protein
MPDASLHSRSAPERKPAVILLSKTEAPSAAPPVPLAMFLSFAPRGGETAHRMDRF